MTRDQQNCKYTKIGTMSCRTAKSLDTRTARTCTPTNQTQPVSARNSLFRESCI